MNIVNAYTALVIVAMLQLLPQHTALTRTGSAGTRTHA